MTNPQTNQTNDDELDRILAGLENSFYNSSIGREVFETKLTKRQAKLALTHLIASKEKAARVDELDILYKVVRSTWIELYRDKRLVELEGNDATKS